MFRVNKQKCLGCRACLTNCPGATELKKDGKAKVINQEKLEKCGGESVCPIGAIEKISNEENIEQFPSESRPAGGRGLGTGGGRGMDAGRGRGLGRGPQDGRGGGKGGGGRRLAREL